MEIGIPYKEIHKISIIFFLKTKHRNELKLCQVFPLMKTVMLDG